MFFAAAPKQHSSKLEKRPYLLKENQEVSKNCQGTGLTTSLFTILSPKVAYPREVISTFSELHRLKSKILLLRKGYMVMILSRRIQAVFQSSIMRVNLVLMISSITILPTRLTLLNSR